MCAMTFVQGKTTSSDRAGSWTNVLHVTVARAGKLLVPYRCVRGIRNARIYWLTTTSVVPNARMKMLWNPRANATIQSQRSTTVRPNCGKGTNALPATAEMIENLCAPTPFVPQYFVNSLWILKNDAAPCVLPTFSRVVCLMDRGFFTEIRSCWWINVHCAFARTATGTAQETDASIHKCIQTKGRGDNRFIAQKEKNYSFGTWKQLNNTKIFNLVGWYSRLGDKRNTNP